MTLDERLAHAIELRGQSQFTEALAILLDLNKKSPEDARVCYELAGTYDSQGMEETAIPFYERAMSNGLADDDLRGCLVGLGSSYRCVERYGDAVRALQRGAAAFPDAKEFDVFLALTRYNMGEHDEAMRLLLHHIGEFTADVKTKRYQRAITYYAEHLNPPYDR